MSAWSRIRLSWLVTAAVVAAVALEAYGFAHGRLFAQQIWYGPGLRRLARYIGLFLEAGLPVLLMAPWLFAPLAAGLILAGTALAAPLGLAAAGLFLVSSWALGSRLFRGAGAACATLAGMAVYVFAMQFSARLPVNYAWVWVAAQAMPVVLQRGRVWRALGRGAAAIARVELRLPGERVAAALLVFVLGMHWLVALKPESGADALAMHLAVPANIAAQHRMTYAPGDYVWSAMPMAADWSYAIVYLAGGESAPRLLNFALLLLLLAMLYQAACRWVSRAMALFLTALFAATPIAQQVTGSLFVENFIAAMVFGAVVALGRFMDEGAPRWLWLASLLCGTALAGKVGAFAFLAILLPFACAAVWRHRPGATVAAAAAAILLLASLPPYAIAWHKTGNPVFPFFNARFPSPLLERAVAIREYRFRQPLTWRTLYDLTFHTSRYYEGQDGSFGFEYLLLVPLAIGGAIAARKRSLTMMAAAAPGAMAIVLAMEPNARYLYAALPLLFAPAAAAIARLKSPRAPVAYLAACFALNIYFLPASNWYHKDFYSQLVFVPGRRDRFIREGLPMRDVVRRFTREHPGENLLFLADNDLADVTSGKAYLNSWHQYATWSSLHNAVTRVDMLNLLAGWKVEYVAGAPPAPGKLWEPRGLRDLMDNCAEPVYENQRFFIARIDPACKDESPASRREPPMVSAGVYDDFDSAVRFRGEWERSEQFSAALHRTVSYTDAPGATASLAFAGAALTYIFTKAPNRGIAELAIDGAVKATIDLYAPSAEWQSRYRVCCLRAGRHTATLRVLGRKRAEASGAFVDVDGFVVE